MARSAGTQRNGWERANRPQGFILLGALAVMVFLTLAGVSLLMRGLWQTNTGFRTYNRSNALELAQAAADQAALNLRTPGLTDDVMTATLSTGTSTVEQQTPLGGSLYRVVGRGTSDTEQRRVEVILTLTPQSAFQFALFGDQGVDVSGNAITDSYDSRLGPYNDNQNSPSYNAGHHGDVGTNSTASGGIAVGGSIFVDGQLAVGPNVSNPVSVVSGYNPAFITGGTSPPTDTQDVISQASTFAMTDVTVPLGLTCNDFTAQGNQTTTLPPGTYCYHNLTIQGNADLTASGKVTIYLTGQLIARGNSTVGVVNDPAKMLFLMSSTSAATLEEGTITGSNKFYGALYGPKATINITGNAEVYGSIVAKTVNLTGSAEIHRDVALSDLTDVTNMFTVASRAWREL